MIKCPPGFRTCTSLFMLALKPSKSLETQFSKHKVVIMTSNGWLQCLEMTGSFSTSQGITSFVADRALFSSASQSDSLEFNDDNKLSTYFKLTSNYWTRWKKILGAPWIEHNKAFTQYQYKEVKLSVLHNMTWIFYWWLGYLKHHDNIHTNFKLWMQGH